MLRKRQCRFGIGRVSPIDMNHGALQSSLPTGLDVHIPVRFGLGTRTRCAFDGIGGFQFKVLALDRDGVFGLPVGILVTVFGDDHLCGIQDLVDGRTRHIQPLGCLGPKIDALFALGIIKDGPSTVTTGELGSSLHHSGQARQSKVR